MASASSAHALVGAKLGYNYWTTANHSGVHSVYANFEHFIPLIPNASVRYSQVDSNKLQFDSLDAFGYYRILDNGKLDLDLGLGLRNYSSGKVGEVDQESFSKTLPMVNAELTLFDGSRTSFYSRVDLGKTGSTDFHQFEAGVRFNMFAGLRLQAGYRTYELDLGKIAKPERLRGLNAGLHWSF